MLDYIFAAEIKLVILVSYNPTNVILTLNNLTQSEEVHIAAGSIRTTFYSALLCLLFFGEMSGQNESPSILWIVFATRCY